MVTIPPGRRLVLPATAAFLALFVAMRAGAQRLPSELSDSAFWRMIVDFSEPGGYFRSDNFVSNETSFQYVIPELQRLTRPGGVYVGVAPDQNFTYVVALQPAIAFIVDIRRQNMLEHLMYKALIEASADRAEFLSRLFSRPRPPAVSPDEATLDSTATVEALVRAYGAIKPDTTLFRANLDQIKNRLTRTHGFALSPQDLRGIDYVYDAFMTAGPALTYSFASGGYGYGRNMPTYGDLMVETDGKNVHRSYLATEANYRALRALETRNLVVPLVGDFAGAKALRAVGQYLRDHQATVSAFYVSNVEQYLFQQRDDWKEFYLNVATLPIDSASTFIRSVSSGWTGPQQSAASHQVSLLCPIGALLDAFSHGRIQSYYDVIELSK